MSRLSNELAEAFINYSNAFKQDPKDRETAEQQLKLALKRAIDFVSVNIYLDNDAAKLPEYAHYEDGHATDACCDVVATSVEVTPDGRIKCGTGIHVATDVRDSITIRPNSRITKIGLVIANSPATIDESYRGEVFVVFRSITNAASCPIKVGDVICQLECPHHRQILWNPVKTLDDLGKTTRGDGGFGSTVNKNNK